MPASLDARGADQWGVLVNGCEQRRRRIGSSAGRADEFMVWVSPTSDGRYVVETTRSDGQHVEAAPLSFDDYADAQHAANERIATLTWGPLVEPATYEPEWMTEWHAEVLPLYPGDPRTVTLAEAEEIEGHARGALHAHQAAHREPSAIDWNSGYTPPTEEARADRARVSAEQDRLRAFKSLTSLIANDAAARERQGA